MISTWSAKPWSKIKLTLAISEVVVIDSRITHPSPSLDISEVLLDPIKNIKGMGRITYIITAPRSVTLLPQSYVHLPDKTILLKSMVLLPVSIGHQLLYKAHA